MVDLGRLRNGEWRRAALLLAACALLFRIAIPAGWMPQASAGGVTLGWCSGTTHAVPAEARAMVAKALGDRKAPSKPVPEQPCAFAAAAQAMPTVDAAPAIVPPVPATDAAPETIAIVFPGRGLAAPPPLSTGPPLLA